MTAVQSVSPAKPSVLSPSSAGWLNDLRALVRGSVDAALLEAELLARLDDELDVQAVGGAVALAAAELNLSRGYISKRLTIGCALVAPLGVWRVSDAGINDLEVLYYAAREVLAGRVNAQAALERVRGCNREAALTALNVPQDERRPLSGRYTRPTCESWQRALDRTRTLGFGPEQTVERLSVMLLEASPERVRGLLNATEVVS